MKKKSTKDKLIEEFKKRSWGMDKIADNKLLEILHDLMESEKKELKIAKKKSL